MPKRTSITGGELFIVDNSDHDWKAMRYVKALVLYQTKACQLADRLRFSDDLMQYLAWNRWLNV